MAAKLVDHLQMVGHLKGIAGRCIYKIFLRPKVGFEQTPLNCHAHRPESDAIFAPSKFGTPLARLNRLKFDRLQYVTV